MPLLAETKKRLKDTSHFKKRIIGNAEMNMSGKA